MKFTPIRCLLPLAVGFAGTLSLRELDDFDTWWHLASGRWIAVHGQIPSTDTLSFTARDSSWINQQWLFDLLAYHLFSFGGAELLVAASALVLTLASWLLLRNLRSSVGPLAAAVLLTWLMFVVQERFSARPEMATFVLLEIFILVLSRSPMNGGRRLWCLPLLMVAWVNLHSLFVLGLFAVVCSAAAATLPESWQFLRGRDLRSWRRRLYVCTAATGLSTLAGPWFLRGALFPFTLLSRINGSSGTYSNIGEFQPPFSGYFTSLSVGAYQAFLFFSVAVICAATAIALGPKGRSPLGFSRGHVGGRYWWPAHHVAGLLVFAGAGWLSLMARRNMAVFAFMAAPFVASCVPLCASYFPRRLAPWLASWRTTVDAAAALALVILCALVSSDHFYRWAGEPRAFGMGVLEVNVPRRAAEFAAAAELSPMMYNDMTAGGYLAWADPLGRGVFIDGRLEVYDGDFYARYSSGLRDARLWDEEAERFAVNTVLIFHRWANRHALIRRLHRHPDWELLYYDEVAVVFARRPEDREGLQRWLQLARERVQRNEDRLGSLGSTALRYPLWEITALESYANLLVTLGEPWAAARFDHRLLELGAAGDVQARARIRLAAYYSARGERYSAVEELEKALLADPDNPQAARLLKGLAR